MLQAVGLQEGLLGIEEDADERRPVVQRHVHRVVPPGAGHVAADQRQTDSRFLTGSEVEELLHLADDALDPARVVHARLEVAVLEQALSELTARQRDILLAARVEEVPHQEIAARYGISVRMVGKELRKALEFCGERLDRKVFQRFGPGAGNES